MFESDTTEFTFSEKYKFSCKKCGACCHVRTLSLKGAEFERLKTTIDQSQYEELTGLYLMPTMRFHDVSFKGKDCTFLESTDTAKSCKIYNTRFLVCRLFPLAITALPTGELLVSLLHCNGVSTDEGELVDERFVTKVLDSLGKTDPSFLRDYTSECKSHHEDLQHFYTRFDLTDFDTKRNFFHSISRWIMNPTISNRAIDVRIRTVEELLSNHLPHKLQRLTEKFRLRQPPLIVSEEDILQFTNEIEKGLETKLPEIAERVEAQKQASLRGILSRGKTEVLLEGKPRELNLDDKMAYFGPRMEKYEITIGESLVEKPLAHEATQLLDNYIEEVLHRIDHGGFPADIPIADALETLCRYAQNILTTAKVYSTGNGKIEDKHMNDAIVYLDTRCALNSTLTSVLQEYSNRP